MALRCRNCDCGRANKLNVRLYVDERRVVYPLICCDDCIREEEEEEIELGIKKLYRTSVRPEDLILDKNTTIHSNDRGVERPIPPTKNNENE